LKLKDFEQKELFAKKYGVLFEIFKEKEYLQVAFFKIITLKRILFSITLVLLNYYTSTSQIFFILIDLALIYFLIKT
jgi:hypothetical protein